MPRSPARPAPSSTTWASAALPARGCSRTRVFDKIVDGLTAEARQAEDRPWARPRDQLGPLVSDEQHEQVLGYLESGRSEGAEVVTGGGTHGNPGYFVEPTVLANTKRDMRIVREEIFGPVICVQPFEDDDLDSIAASPTTPTTACPPSIWTRDLTAPTGSRARSGPARSGQHPQLRRRGFARSAATSSRAGAARWARRSWSTTPRPRPWACAWSDQRNG